MRIATLFFLLLTCAACSSDEDKKELKSPCVAAPTNQSDHPCGPRIRINDRWLEHS